jgi:hypothetical protein
MTPQTARTAIPRTNATASASSSRLSDFSGALESSIAVRANEGGKAGKVERSNVRSGIQPPKSGTRRHAGQRGMGRTLAWGNSQSREAGNEKEERVAGNAAREAT